MADVEIKYNNATIASLSDSGTEVLETNGTFLTDDITVEYTKSGGGGVQTTAIAASFKGKAYYTDASGTVQTITAATPMPGVDSFSDNAISTSICTILSGSVLSSTGLTLIERFDLGSGATHRYAYIYQVN